MAQERDLSLDYLKGIGCAMMLLAHSAVQQSAGLVILALFFFGHLAPVLFFAVTGVTAQFQARRHSLSHALAYFGALFLFGLSYSGMFSASPLSDFKFEILQIIALGALAVVLLARALPQAAALLWLAVGLGLFALKLLLDLLAPEIDGAGLLMPAAHHVPWHLLKTGESLVLTGFPLLPWLAFFFIGCAAYRLSSRTLFGLTLAALLGLGIVAGLGLEVDLRNKWDMSATYFLQALVLLFAAFLFARRYLSRPVRGLGVLLDWGRNSLLFLYVHLLLTFVAALLSKGDVLVQLAISIPLTWLVMAGLIRLKPARCFQRLWAWLLLGGLIWLPMLLLKPDEPAEIIAFMAMNCLLGAIFAFNYKSLGALLDRMLGRPAS